MDIVFSSTTQLAAAIRAGHVSATEVLKAHLSQIEAYNPTLNAVITIDAEDAYARARQADEALARGEYWGPLHGVPFTLKDALATKGMRTTTGFPPLANYIPEVDSTVAARLKAAGGILLGKTNVAMLLADYQSANPIFQRTNNPWNVERTAGGSSGGAAAALAAGMTPFEIGTDLSASIRIPAHFCGVAGLKPTEQRVPLTGLIPGLPGPRPVRIMSCIGPMARTVEDLALLYGIIAGPDGQDIEVAPVPIEGIPQLELKHLRVAVASTFPGIPVATEIRAAVEELARQLTPLCATVEETSLPHSNLQQDLARAGELIGMMVGAFEKHEQKPPTSLAHYLEALHLRDQSILAWEQFFAKWDVLLCPPSMVTAFPHCEPGTPLQVDGQETSYYMTAAHGTLFNYTGHPAIVLPYKQDRDGLPIGIQIVGKRWSESRLLATARAITEVTGAFQRPPGY
ncbi:amidase [Ktedonosporobacter rubrisoli]|uniref:Amidase n=1 Tax=Ktedonosporobacter rubrisoli TaxID=2509675 RepID=A0A4P6JMY1_KTERU|nr:amidase [Ktedonosporobacter rubrisoli]QBD76648.1 amidase [Ktedonosporobacter rubrisoli]